jgi:branched-chain amino acid aminotransferase
MQETAKIWMNGELVDWADATVHVGVHGLHYGTGAFEGIRAYETERGPAVFRLADHLQRLHDSARLLYMDVPYTVEELRSATADRVLRLRLARRPHARQPGRDRDHELAVGCLPRR